VGHVRASRGKNKSSFCNLFTLAIHIECSSGDVEYQVEQMSCIFRGNGTTGGISLRVKSLGRITKVVSIHRVKVLGTETNKPQE
jgi:hypothetical protein